MDMTWVTFVGMTLIKVDIPFKARGYIVTVILKEPAKCVLVNS